MSLIKSNYEAPFGFSNGHVQSIFPTLFRHIRISSYQRFKINTPDDDFLDYDMINRKSSKCVILSHGLEGSSNRCYMTGMARYFSENGFDVCAWNYRGCSNEINLKPRFYHSGATEDLHTIITHLEDKYEELYLIGFSMGGNLSLKYLGERQYPISKKLTACVVFSVPVDLNGSCLKLSRKSNSIYMRRFLKKLKEKVVLKEHQFPNLVSSKNYNKIKNFFQFDDRYTAPLHGFKSAKDYYRQCSSKQFIKDIKIPALIVNALNDPFLSESCYPYEECSSHKYVNLETPKSGGHIGFLEFGKQYWSEKRALEFILSIQR